MEFHPLSLRLLCTIFVAILSSFLEGGCALGVRGHAANRLRGGFLEKLKSSTTTTTKSYVSSMGQTSYNYTQVLDHFAFTPQSYQTFPQRYFIDSSKWGGAQNNSPIFVWLGAEQDVTYDVGDFMIEQLPDFKALGVYIEHRYYGTSMPFGGENEAYANTSTMGYFTSTQALADYATIIVDLKKLLNADNCPVVVFGASYGGMLAAWFRLKYPHITIGALASSAPILYLDGIAPTLGYDSVVTKDFRNVSESCYRRINESWDLMDQMASSPQGMLNLSKLFNTCQNITDTADLYSVVISMYESSAQYNFEKVKRICAAIDSLPGDADTITRIAYAANSSNTECLDLSPFNYSQPNWFVGWDWQTCTEMVFPWADPAGSTMFPPYSFDINNYSRDCYLKYGVVPRQHWATTQYGGHDIKKVLKDFGSNIIFSNGLRDPWSSGGVLEDISESIVAIPTEEGTHCQDIDQSSTDDPAWLKEQRQKEIINIQKWINDYKS